MITYLVDIFDLLIRPFFLGFSICVSGLIFSLWRRNQGLVVIAGGIAFLWIFSTPWVGGALMADLERSFPPKSVDSVSEADAIVVLSGGIEPATGNRIYPDLKTASDRIWHASRLHKAGVAPVILVSGGRSPQRGDSEAPAMKEFLRDLGVPADSIILESKSRSTRENATYTNQISDDQNIEQVVLVTSAFHMPRALDSFRQAGFERIIPAPTDHRTSGAPMGVFGVIPGMNGLSSSMLAFREHAAYFYYWCRGWVE